MYFNPDTNQFELEVNDEAWIVPGYSENTLIAIKTTIVHVDDTFRKENPQGRLFYLVDEPYGYPIPGNELFTKQEAIAELKKRYKEELEAWGIAMANASLEDYRRGTEAFIEGTWEDNGEEHPGFAQWLDKKLGEEWFNYQSLQE